MPESSILDTAIAAHNAGLCPIRAKTDGSKAPYGTWKHRQSERPDLSDVMAEFASWPNVGLVMGAVSDRLICLEMEGRFMEDFDTAVERLKAADLYDVFASWIDGYSEKSPGGGIHVLVHVGGDGPVPGNIKVAADSLHQTLIETRGEGGFLIVAPSNGTTHPSGGKWEMIRGSFDEIAWATPEEFAGVLGVLASFNVERTLGGESLPPVSPQRTFEGESRFDEYLATLPSVLDVLASLGWEQVGQDSEGIHVKRPGKPEPGKSGSVNHNGRLYVHSSSTPLTRSEELGHRTYDALDIILAYDLGRNPTPDERSARFREWRRGTVSPPSPRLAADPPVSSDLYLPPEFWSATPVLQAIHDAALQQILAPEGVLGAFLSSYATTVPMSIVIPKIVGVESPLNCYAALVDRSGGGKTTSIALALELLGYNEGDNRDVLLGRSLRSGEGLITLACIPKTKDNPDPGFRHGVQVVFDEGGALGAQASRLGSTTLPYLNTAWAGVGTVGGALASQLASFPAGQVRVCAVMGVQFGAAANLFTGDAEALGFPQRLLYFGLSNPVLATLDVGEGNDDLVQPVGVQFWRHGEARHRTKLVVPGHIRREVREWAQARKAMGREGKLDSHQMLLQLRTAALFALMDGRGTLNDQDWQLAGCICATSRAVRSTLVQSLGDVVLDRERARGHGDAVRAEAADTVWLLGKAERLARHLQGVEAGKTKTDLKAFLNKGERLRREEILEHGIAHGLIALRDGRYFRGDR